MRILPAFVLLIINLSGLQAQRHFRNDINTIYLHFHWAYQIPGGDLKMRFGPSQAVGIDAEWMTGRHAVAFGMRAAFFYGSRVKEDVAALFRNAQGWVFGTDRTATQIILRERGWWAGVHIGKLFPVHPARNPRSGIRLSLSGGFIRHRIKVQDQFDSARQFQGEYAKGYDRLTGGLYLAPFVGYQHTSLNRYINLIAGVEWTLAGTRSLRSWDYDLMRADTRRRADRLMNFLVGFSLPLFVGDSGSDVEY